MKPPYSKHIKPNHKDVVIYCGDLGWDLAKGAAMHPSSTRGTLVLPQAKKFKEYEWPVKGKWASVFFFDLPRKIALKFAHQLMDAGAIGATIDFGPKCRESVCVRREEGQQ